MFLIGSVVVLLLAIVLGRPLIRRLARPLAADHPRMATTVRIVGWSALLLLVSWPLTAGPALFAAQCRFLAELQVSPAVDARSNGYLDERLTVPSLVQTHLDQLFFVRDVEDLVSGRVKFFEKANSAADFPGRKPFSRYALAQDGTGNCIAYNRDLQAQAPGKCLAREDVAEPASQFVITVTGNVNHGDATTTITHRPSKADVAVFRSFAKVAFPYGGSTICPIVHIDGDNDSAHIGFASLVFVDRAGATKMPRLGR